jgi:putative DNA primase/helicase
VGNTMTQTFEDALQQAGYPIPLALTRDGEIHRFGEKNRCWYVAGDGFGIAGDWKEERGKVSWQNSTGLHFLPTDKKALWAKIKLRQREYEAEKLEEQFEAAKVAARLLASCKEKGQSAYLIKKRAGSFGIRYGMDTAAYIAVPLRDVAGTLWSIQKIYDDGSKQFLKGGRKKGCFHILGKLEVHMETYVCEGYATGTTIHEVTGKPVCVCFDAGNMKPVLAALASFYTVKNWVIAADNDAYTDTNIGKIKAEEAAQQFGCRVLSPHFKDTATKPTDYNDLAVLEGLEAVKRQLSATAPVKTLASITLHDFLNHCIPQREMILAPVIPTQGLVMLYAMRGIGKTHVSLSVALTVATGGGMLGGRWKAEKARHVLFVDGEMPAIVLQQRLAAMVAGAGQELPEKDYLRIITPDWQESGIPDLATVEGQAAIEQHLQRVELLILDNLSSLCRSGKENEAESWMPVQEWMLSLRKRGISVLLVHHAGKTGAQRGTSKREDLLDSVIALKRPADYETSQGARFEIHYEKARGFQGEDAKPFEAHLTGDATNLRWEVKDTGDSLKLRVLELKKEGLSQRDIAVEAGCSPAKVNRILKKCA